MTDNINENEILSEVGKSMILLSNEVKEIKQEMENVKI